eukprot:Gb_26989 [translate_table: standard]
MLPMLPNKRCRLLGQNGHMSSRNFVCHLESSVVPAATVFGASWPDWQRLFAHTKLVGGVDYAVCLPAYGAVIGAWFGAWPMPLDWERIGCRADNILVVVLMRSKSTQGMDGRVDKEE